ncbi:TPA: hypothetical protein JAW29_003041 [Citrobacter freundii]|uniref:Uncharacterized protein n=1 Tax=uncultured Citrobacter sp. TaxID=200446 RepID=A0A212ILZ9_9ENTR|nr:hypothetical protein [Citrobacter freundii]MBJ9533196.1 hypothetical protein [Citrobacter freundii]NUN37142.1 hypothetical protein [Citrobacter freundii]SBV66200.1 conserved hypothetical protein [uncultured Citrobacter sp.]SBV67840.1 conserved hypothetical protein [uncultured Citrobacter sp.]HAT7555791.1 hypothetical protein [Citrobacter freundii]
MNKATIYDSAFGLWGYDRQVLATAEECSELAASCTRFINHKSNAARVAEEAADVEIMIEQLRHNGMNDMIEQSKARALTRLAQRVGVEAPPITSATPHVSTLLKDGLEQFEMAEALYLDRETSNRLAAAGLRRCIGLLMHAAQLMIREQQQAEQRRDGK